jgi:protein ImuA
MNKDAKLVELRHFMARQAPPPEHPAVPLGHEAADAVLGGGLRRGALHEVFATGWSGGGFALLMALRLAGRRPLFWVRSDYAALEYGAAGPHGIAALMPPGRIEPPVVVRAGAADALAAASDILACPHVGCLLLEMEANPKVLDLTASRRLVLAAEETGVGLVLLREGAREEASAAHTRWRARAAPSDPDDDDWGRPRFHAELVRHRMGGLGQFLIQWNVTHGLFHAPLPAQFDLPSADPSLRHPPPLALRARGRQA